MSDRHTFCLLQPAALMAVLLAGAGIVRAAPSITQKARANPSPAPSFLVELTVGAADAGDEAHLVYTWEALAKPDAAKPLFIDNASNSAKADRVIVDRPGGYTFQVTVKGADGSTATSAVDVNVTNTPTFVLRHTATTLVPGATQQFEAAVLNQFGEVQPMPGQVNWSVTGGGTISSAGLYTAPAQPGVATITATCGENTKFVRVTTVAAVTADIYANIFAYASKGAESSPSEVSPLLSKLRPDGHFVDLDYSAYTKNRTTSYKEHGRRLCTLTQAYQYNNPGNAFYHSPTLLEQIIGAWKYVAYTAPGVDHIAANGDRTIWIPEAYGYGLILARDLLPKELMNDLLKRYFRDARNWPIPTPTSFEYDGTNLAWLAPGALMDAVLRGDDARITDVVDHVTADLLADPRPEPRYAVIEPDGSFAAHRPWLGNGSPIYASVYSLGYGAYYTDTLSKQMLFTRDTRFAFAKEAVDKALSFLLDTQQWLTFGKAVDLPSLGSGVPKSPTAPSIAIELSDFASRYLALGKRTAEINAWLNRIRNGPSAQNHLTGNHAHFNTDADIHQRANFMASVKLISDRTERVETRAAGNWLGYFEADGFVNLYVVGDEFGDGSAAKPNIYAAWDWRRLPGTTVEQVDTIPYKLTMLGHTDPETLSYLIGAGSFVGSASDGIYGMAAMDYKREHVNVTAKKAYFFFDGEIVELGADISAPKAEKPVFTSINQTLLDGEVTVASADDTEQKLPLGTSIDLKDPRWIHHDHIGYVFVGSNGKVHVQAKTQTGKWSAIGGADEASTLPVFSAWIDHGSSPGGASYAFAMLPGASAAQTEQYTKNPPITVLSNNAGLQAVRQNVLKQTQIVFYTPNAIQVTPTLQVTVDRPILLMVAETTTGIRITAADPTHAPDAHLTVSLSDPTRNRQLSQIKIALPGGERAGASVVSELEFAGADHH